MAEKDAVKEKDADTPVNLGEEKMPADEPASETENAQSTKPAAKKKPVAEDAPSPKKAPTAKKESAAKDATAKEKASAPKKEPAAKIADTEKKAAAEKKAVAEKKAPAAKKTTTDIPPIQSEAKKSDAAKALAPKTTKKLKITLVKSLTGRHNKHIATAISLGLKRIGASKLQPDNPQTRGKIAQIKYMITVEEQP